jgi:crossover junction endodeoxyribonuclease RusA
LNASSDAAGKEWVRAGKVRGRTVAPGAVDVRIDGLTTQSKYYKPLVREFFRTAMPGVRPRWGDFTAHIVMEHVGDPPHMDLDNLAKAMLDSAVGHVFHDDSQVARLLVERQASDREGVSMRLAPVAADGAQAWQARDGLP